MSDPTPRSPRYSFPAPSELVDLGAALRGMLDTMLWVDEESPGVLEDLRAATRAIEADTQRLDRHRVKGEGLRLGIPEESGTGRRYYVQGPMIGTHHPMCPEFEIALEGDVTRGRLSFGPAFEGPPGCVHGGFVAFFFDEILGFHNLATGTRGMTGALDLKYRRPTPLDTELEFQVRTALAQGRKVRVIGELSGPDGVTAQAEGLFIEPAQGFHDHVMKR
ncbi:MAG: PaaI family thioesterase [bacterium]|nr:PaaI family thioesterase [bacterium]